MVVSQLQDKYGVNYCKTFNYKHNQDDYHSTLSS